MFERRFMARWLLIGAAALAVVGCALWYALPISMGFPPYLATSLLMLAYGAYCLKSSRPPRGRRP